MATIEQSIVRRMRAESWMYANNDPTAVSQLKARLGAAGARNSPLTYSELAHGITFQVNGKPRVIDTNSWSEFDQRLIGDYLGYISVETYETHGFMASALAYGVKENRPSDRFFKFMQSVGALSDMSEGGKMRFWSEQLALAYQHYKGSVPLPSASEFFRFVREGERVILSLEARKRCEALIREAKKRLRAQSTTGLLHCARRTCNWANPAPNHFHGDIVEMHHRDPLAEAPPDGVELDLEAAIKGLIPLCPTCHRLVHARPSGGVYTFEELEDLLSRP